MACSTGTLGGHLEAVRGVVDNPHVADEDRWACLQCTLNLSPVLFCPFNYCQTIITPCSPVESSVCPQEMLHVWCPTCRSLFDMWSLLCCSFFNEPCAAQTTWVVGRHLGQAWWLSGGESILGLAERLTIACGCAAYGWCCSSRCGTNGRAVRRQWTCCGAWRRGACHTRSWAWRARCCHMPAPSAAQPTSSPIALSPAALRRWPSKACGCACCSQLPD